MSAAPGWARVAPEPLLLGVGVPERPPHLRPQFSGLWYEVAFATKTGDLGAAYRAQKMAGVVIKMEGGRPTLTAAYYK